MPVCYLSASEGVEFRKGRPGGSGWFWVLLRGLAWGLPHALISWSHSHLRAPSERLWLTGGWLAASRMFVSAGHGPGSRATASLGAALEPRPDAKKEVPDNGPQEAGPLRARFFVSGQRRLPLQEVIPREGFLQRRLGGRRLGGRRLGRLEDGGRGPGRSAPPPLLPEWPPPGHEGLALLREALTPR